MDINIADKDQQGLVRYLWNNRSVYFCIYLIDKSKWDEKRAATILDSFHFTP